MSLIRYKRLQRKHHPRLQKTSNQRQGEGGDSFELPLLIKEKQPRPEKYINNYTCDTTSVGHTGDSKECGGSTTEPIYENDSQFTAPQSAAYADDESILKAKHQIKGFDKSNLQTNPQNSQTTKDEGRENHQNETTESEYELVGEITEVPFDTEMVENPRPEKHINNNACDSTTAGHTGHSKECGRSTNEPTYENVSQVRVSQSDANSDVQSILKAKHQIKGIDKSNLQTNPDKNSQTTKDEGWENHQKGTTESEDELVRKITEVPFDTEMVENPYYDSSE